MTSPKLSSHDSTVLESEQWKCTVSELSSIKHYVIFDRNNVNHKVNEVYTDNSILRFLIVSKEKVESNGGGNTHKRNVGEVSPRTEVSGQAHRKRRGYLLSTLIDMNKIDIKDLRGDDVRLLEQNKNNIAKRKQSDKDAKADRDKVKKTKEQNRIRQRRFKKRKRGKVDIINEEASGRMNKRLTKGSGDAVTGTDSINDVSSNNHLSNNHSASLVDSKQIESSSTAIDSASKTSSKNQVDENVDSQGTKNEPTKTNTSEVAVLKENDVATEEISESMKKRLTKGSGDAVSGTDVLNDVSSNNNLASAVDSNSKTTFATAIDSASKISSKKEVDENVDSQATKNEPTKTDTSEVVVLDGTDVANALSIDSSKKKSRVKVDIDDRLKKKIESVTEDNEKYISVLLECEYCQVIQPAQQIIYAGDEYFDYFLRKQKWWNLDILSTFGSLLYHSVHSTNTVYVTCTYVDSGHTSEAPKATVKLPKNCEKIVFFAHRLSHFVLIAIDITQDKLSSVVIYDALHKTEEKSKEEPWMDHVRFIAEKCRIKITAGGYSVGYHSKGEHGGPQWTQNDAYNCGPIACMYLWHIFIPMEVDVGFPISELRTKIITKMKELLLRAKDENALTSYERQKPFVTKGRHLSKEETEKQDVKESTEKKEELMKNNTTTKIGSTTNNECDRGKKKGKANTEKQDEKEKTEEKGIPNFICFQNNKTDKKDEKKKTEEEGPKTNKAPTKIGSTNNYECDQAKKEVNSAGKNAEEEDVFSSKGEDTFLRNTETEEQAEREETEEEELMTNNTTTKNESTNNVEVTADKCRILLMGMRRMESKLDQNLSWRDRFDLERIQYIESMNSKAGAVRKHDVQCYTTRYSLFEKEEDTAGNGESATHIRCTEKNFLEELKKAGISSTNRLQMVIIDHVRLKDKIESEILQDIVGHDYIPTIEAFIGNLVGLVEQELLGSEKIMYTDEKYNGVVVLPNTVFFGLLIFKYLSRLESYFEIFSVQKGNNEYNLLWKATDNCKNSLSGESDVDKKYFLDVEDACAIKREDLGDSGRLTKLLEGWKKFYDVGDPSQKAVRKKVTDSIRARNENSKTRFIFLKVKPSCQYSDAGMDLGDNILSKVIFEAKVPSGEEEKKYFIGVPNDGVGNCFFESVLDSGVIKLNDLKYYKDNKGLHSMEKFAGMDIFLRCDFAEKVQNFYEQNKYFEKFVDTVFVDHSANEGVDGSFAGWLKDRNKKYSITALTEYLKTDRDAWIVGDEFTVMFVWLYEVEIVMFTTIIPEALSYFSLLEEYVSIAQIDFKQLGLSRKNLISGCIYLYHHNAACPLDNSLSGTNTATATHYICLREIPQKDIVTLDQYRQDGRLLPFPCIYDITDIRTKKRYLRYTNYVALEVLKDAAILSENLRVDVDKEYWKSIFSDTSAADGLYWKVHIRRCICKAMEQFWEENDVKDNESEEALYVMPVGSNGTNMSDKVDKLPMTMKIGANRKSALTYRILAAENRIKEMIEAKRSLYGHKHLSGLRIYGSSCILKHVHNGFALVCGDHGAEEQLYELIKRGISNAQRKKKNCIVTMSMDIC